MSEKDIFGIKGVYEVGGHVRDQLLGLQSKDLDYAVECDSYEQMEAWVQATHAKVFDIPGAKANFTVRALAHSGEPRDYVLCRKDGPYSDSRRPDWVEPGSIYDDLARRDFTVNAIARCARTGELLDPHGGQQDLAAKRLACVGNTIKRFDEDTLRIVRAIRFCVTKQLTPSEEITRVLAGTDGLVVHWLEKLQELPSDRIRQELDKSFRFSTGRTLSFMSAYLNTMLRDALFQELWLKPTSESK